MEYIFIKSTKQALQGYGTIYIRTRANKLNRKYSTGVVLRETDWKKYRSLQYVSSRMITPMGINFGQLATLLSVIKITLEADFDPDKAASTIRSIKAKVLNGEQLPTKGNTKTECLFSNYIEQYIEELKNGSRQRKGTSSLVSNGYITNIKTLLNNIRKYENERNVKLTLENITMDFQRDFLKWLTDKGHRPNTIHSTLSRIRSIMSAAYESKLTRTEDFHNSQFVPQGELVDHIYLTKNQVDELISFDLSSPETIREHILNANVNDTTKKKWLSRITTKYATQLANSKDEFVIGCLTGQRISDYKRISLKMLIDIDNTEFISLIQEKTGKKVLIPLDKRVKEILMKHNGSLPHINDSTFNRNLKFIAELIGWTYEAKIDRHRMGFKSGPRFCDMLCSHTARRTFATIAYSEGVPLRSIMTITGHTTESSLRKYLKLQPEEKAIIAAKDFERIMQL